MINIRRIEIWPYHLHLHRHRPRIMINNKLFLPFFLIEFNRIVKALVIKHNHPKNHVSFYINQRQAQWTMAIQISHSFKRIKRMEMQVSASSFQMIDPFFQHFNTLFFRFLVFVHFRVNSNWKERNVIDSFPKFCDCNILCVECPTK